MKSSISRRGRRLAASTCAAAAVLAAPLAAQANAAIADLRVEAGGQVLTNASYTTSTEEITTDHLLGLAPHYALVDLASVSRLLYDGGLSQLQALGPVVANPPVFVLGWADGDLVLGDCLVDVKATVRPLRLDPYWLYQLVAYALLDAADLYGIRQVGIYLARQGTLVSWQLDELISTLTEPSPSWQQLQADFCALLGPVAPDFGGTRWLTRPTPPIDLTSPRRGRRLRPRPVPNARPQE